MSQPSRAARHLVTLVLVGVLGACTGAGEVDRTATVEGVTVGIPPAWTEQSTDEVPGVAASRRWAPGEGVENLQVVVGCDGTAAELAAGAAQTPRDPLVVTDAVEVDAPAVDGLDAVHRLRITLGAGRQDDASTVRVSGLYGEAGDAIVLVEVAQRAGADDDVADEVLGSVGVDAAALRDACAERG